MEIVQGNGYNATFDLTQSGNELHGTGRYSEARSRSIDGSVGENGFDFTVHWSNGAIGYYAGGFSSDGGIASQSAYTYDKAHPGHRVYWDAPGRQAKCVKSAEATPAPPPAAPPPPPPAAPAPPAPVQPQGFAGIWDSKTGDGVSYTLTLDAQGSGSVGAVDARLDGTLQGGLSTDGKRLSFVMTQPGAGIVSGDSSHCQGTAIHSPARSPRILTAYRAAGQVVGGHNLEKGNAIPTPIGASNLGELGPGGRSAHDILRRSFGCQSDAGYCLLLAFGLRGVQRI